MYTKLSINERVKVIRTSAGLTLDKFGERVGVSRAAISNIENGNRSVTDQMFKSICREFNVNENWLRTGEGDIRVPQTRNQKIMAFANQVMADEDESFRKRFVTALGNARPEFWDELEKFLDALKKD